MRHQAGEQLCTSTIAPSGTVITAANRGPGPERMMVAPAVTPGAARAAAMVIPAAMNANPVRIRRPSLMKRLLSR
jgi:hypothetical protein